jgi:two-component system nitrate/nitrite response regulator NarL
MKAITVYLLGPDRLFRAGLCRLLDDTEISVCGTGTTLAEALRAIGDAPPDVMLVDCAAGDPPRLDEICAARKALPQMRIVVMMDCLSVPGLAQYLAAGAQGYLVKTISSAALKQSLALVILGEKVFPTTLASSMANSINAAEEKHPLDGPIAGLSAREVEVLKALVTGKPNKMIAHALGVTESTVKVHLKTILRKIRVANRTQAAIWAVNNGMMLQSPQPAQSHAGRV